MAARDESFMMLMKIIQTRAAIRNLSAENRWRLANIEAGAVERIGEIGAQTAARIGGTRARGRRELGGIAAHERANVYNARVNMLNTFLGRGGIADILIQNPGLLSWGRSSMGGSAAPDFSYGNALGPRMMP